MTKNNLNLSLDYEQGVLIIGITAGPKYVLPHMQPYMQAEKQTKHKHTNIHCTHAYSGPCDDWAGVLQHPLEFLMNPITIVKCTEKAVIFFLPGFSASSSMQHPPPLGSEDPTPFLCLSTPPVKT